MRKPANLNYEKKDAFRDATLFLIFCEGEKTEPNYFKFFIGISSQIKIIPISSNHKSAPQQLIDNASNIIDKYNINEDFDNVWFVIDTDNWSDQLHEIRKNNRLKKNWKIAQSNPCFEVWLYYHLHDQKPILDNMNKCNSWKQYIPTILNGGFNPLIHPIEIERAIHNAQINYTCKGYWPDLGCTQVWELAKEILPLIKKDLKKIKDSFYEI